MSDQDGVDLSTLKLGDVVFELRKSSAWNDVKYSFTEGVVKRITPTGIVVAMIRGEEKRFKNTGSGNRETGSTGWQNAPCLITPDMRDRLYAEDEPARLHNAVSAMSHDFHKTLVNIINPTDAYGRRHPALIDDDQYAKAVKLISDISEALKKLRGPEVAHED